MIFIIIYNIFHIIIHNKNTTNVYGRSEDPSISLYLTAAHLLILVKFFLSVVPGTVSVVCPVLSCYVELQILNSSFIHLPGTVSADDRSKNWCVCFVLLYTKRVTCTVQYYYLLGDSSNNSAQYTNRK